jgi:hypothetical protein
MVLFLLVEVLFFGSCQRVSYHTYHAANVHWLAEWMNASTL